MSSLWLAGRWPLKLNEADGAHQQMILAHGAGAGMESKFMECLAQQLSDNRVRVVRFEFEYMAGTRTGLKRRPPPAMAALVEQWHGFFEAFRASGFYRDLPVIAAGKSMGARVASHAVVERPGPYRHLVCFGYPFHAKGRPDKTRTQHLPDVALPALVVQGTRDAFGTREEVATYALGGLRMHWLDAADHDFVPMRGCGMIQRQMIGEAARVASLFNSP